MAKTSIAGTQLEVEEHGQGEPVVLVHGSISDLRTWDALTPLLARRHRVIRYSRRFHWPNAPMGDGDTYRMEQHVDDLRQLIDAVVRGPAHVVGNSWGAYVALVLAMRHPDRVRSLVLEEPPLLPLFVGAPPSPVRLLPLFFTRPRTAFAFVHTIATGLAPAESALKKGDKEKAMLTFARMAVTPEFFARMTPARLEQARQNLAALEGDVTGKGLLAVTPSEVRRVTTPALVMVGAQSNRILPRVCERLTELLPNGRKVSVANASHLMHEDNPDEVSRLVLEFLEAQGREPLRAAS
jgi:pimeloyl-ACP methyl ester carboxylesterase